MKKILKIQPLHDLLITLGLLLLTTVLTFLLFFFISRNSANVAIFYIIGIMTIARYTNGYFFGILASFFSIIFINCFFTYPYFSINFSISDYPFTFTCMLALSLITSTTTTNLKKQTEILALHERQLIEAEKEKMRANLLRAISHDLRTPLTSTLGYISSIEANANDYNPREYQELIHHIHDDASWLLNMVENLLSVTKIQTGDSKLNTIPEIVDEVIAESIIRFKKRMPYANIDVTIPSEILMVPMDAMLIEQVLINLMENAYTHSQSTKPIQLIVENHPQDICFRIIDQGIGLQEEQLEHLFDGTYSNASSSDVRKGMGIGLSICNTIITAHKGKIIAKNHTEGAEFLFTLPKEESHA